jgi:ketosteroid isomerase-like protein
MKTLFGMLMMLALTAGTVLAECSAENKAALEAWDKNWTTANQSGDRGRISEFLADDFVALPDGTTKAQSIENAMSAFERNKTNPTPNKTSHDHYMISCTPNSATITHRNVIWTANGTGGKPETFWTRSVHVLEKRNGKWMAVTNAGHGLDEFDTIAYLEEDWNNAVMTRNRAWFEKHFADDFTSVSTMTGEVSGKKKDIDGMINDKGLEWAGTSDMNVNVNGNMAVVTGIFHTKGKDDKGVAYDRRVRYIDTWVKRDGVWQAWTSQGTALPKAESVAKQ